MASAIVQSVAGKRRCSKQITEECKNRRGWWPESGFSPKKGGSGFHSHCRDCRRQLRRNYGRKHQQALATYTKKWQEANPYRIRELRRNWYLANREHERSKSAAFKKANPVLYRGYQRMRLARLEDGPRLSDAEWLEVVAVCGAACLKCGSEEDVTIDHIVPVSRGGQDTKDNVQPLCRACNSSKKRKVIDYRPPAARRVLVTPVPG
jgi:5-methylcytosine-specific restriction endonuclease McrA